MHVDYNKVYACFGVKISKNTSIKNFKQGGARPARRRWIRLCLTDRSIYIIGPINFAEISLKQLFYFVLFFKYSKRDEMYILKLFQITSSNWTYARSTAQARVDVHIEIRFG